MTANRNDLLELSASLIEVASGRELALAERLQANLETAAAAMAAARAEPYVEGSTGQLRALAALRAAHGRSGRAA